MKRFDNASRMIVLVMVLVVGLLPAGTAGPASAYTATTGSIVGYGLLSAPGLTTSPSLATTPDPAQWQTWPGRSWRLTSSPTIDPTYGGPCIANRPGSTKDGPRLMSSCYFSITGWMHGWCDLSKGIGDNGSYFYANAGEWAYINSLRWTGVATTLTVTADLESYAPGFIGPNGPVHGTLTGTVTLLGTGMSLLDLCTDPDGIQSSIPVAVDFHYVLQ